jgi:galactokinase
MRTESDKVFPATDRGVWVAPGRVNLIGEHTDYNDGFVLPFALAQRMTVTAAKLSGPKRWSLTSAQASGSFEITPADIDPAALVPGRLVPERLEGWTAYVAGVIWALTDAGYDVPAAEFAFDSDVPVGAGLSSSAALECAVLCALCDLGGLDLAVTERPRVAQRAENDYVGMPCGIMDQSASTLCQDGKLLFLDCRSLETEHIPCDLAAAGLTVLVIDSRAEHRHVDNEYANRRRTCEQAARLLGLPALRDVDDLDAALAALPDPIMRRRVRHVVTENQRVLDAVALLRADRIRDIGPLLTGSHASMRDDYEITVPEVDLAVDVALANGAYGARMTGGGFGGCVVALIEQEAAGTVSAAVEKAYAQRGYTPPVSFAALPSAGARRLA